MQAVTVGRNDNMSSITRIIANEATNLLSQLFQRVGLFESKRLRSSYSAKTFKER